MEETRMKPTGEEPHSPPTSPLDLSRKKTDVYFTAIFYLLFVVWIAVVFCALTGLRLNPSKEPMDLEFLEDIPKFSTFVYYKIRVEELFDNRTLAIACVCTVFAIIGIVLFLRLLRYRTKVCTVAGLVIAVISIVASIARIVQLFLMRFDGPSMLLWILFLIFLKLVSIVYLVVACVAIRSVRLKRIADVMRDAYRVFFFFLLRMCLFGACLLKATVLTLYLSVAAFQSSTGSPALIILELITGYYLMSFINSFGKAVGSMVTATWHSHQDKKDLPEKLFWRCTTTTFKYHLGTVAYDAIPIIPMVTQLIATRNTKWKVNGDRFKMCMNVFLEPYLIFYRVDYPIAATAIYGKSYYHSAKLAFRTLAKNSALTLSFHYIHDCATIFAVVVVTLLALSPYTVWFIINYPVNFWNLYWVAILSYSFTWMIMSPVITVVDCIVNANLLCTLDKEDLEDGEACQRNPNADTFS